MNIKSFAIVASLALGIFVNSQASAVTYTFVGSWLVDQGPSWTTNPTVYTGQQAAAFLFGGTSSQYAISTTGNDPALINFRTWLDGWGDPNTYGLSGSPAPENYSLDSGAPGYNSFPSYSALVEDHNLGLRNFAFLITGVPELSTWTMMVLGFFGVGFMAYRRKGPAFRLA